MASASNSKTIYASASKTYGYDLKVLFNEGTTSTSNNTSPISISGSMLGNKIGWSSSGKSKLELYWYDDNQNASGKLVASKEFTKLDKNATVTLNGSITVTHKNDGTLNGYAKLVFTKGGSSSYTPSSTDLSTANTALTKIPRYGTSNQSLNSKTETSIIINWSSDNNVDRVYYSINNGDSWSSAITVNAKSGSYTINNLKANTTYNVKTRIRRKDSGLTTDSSNLPVTTYDYPYATKCPNFIVGNSLTLTLYNPLKRNCRVYITPNGGNDIDVGTTTTTTIGGFDTSSVQDLLFKASPNSATNAYTAKCVYSTSAKVSNSGTYTIAKSPPDLDFSFKDINPVTIELTGDENIIVLNKSNVQVDLNTTAKNYATIKKIVVNNLTIAADTKNLVINNSSTSTYVVTATDSRGFETTKTLTKDKIDYIPLTISVLFKRKTPTTGEVDLDYSGNYFNGNFGLTENFLEIKYSYRKKGESNWSEPITLEPIILEKTFSQKLTLPENYDYKSTYEFIIFFKDKLVDTNISGTPNTIVPPGEPVFWWNDVKMYINKDLFLKSGNQVLDYEIIDEWEDE